MDPRRAAVIRLTISVLILAVMAGTVLPLLLGARTAGGGLLLAGTLVVVLVLVAVAVGAALQLRR